MEEQQAASTEEQNREAAEELNLDPRHLRERRYEAEQVYTDRCPELELFTAGAARRKKARQAAETAERSGMLQELRFLPQSQTPWQAEVQAKAEAMGLFAVPRAVSYLREPAKRREKVPLSTVTLCGVGLLLLLISLWQWLRFQRADRQKATKDGDRGDDLQQYGK